MARARLLLLLLCSAAGKLRPLRSGNPGIDAILAEGPPPGAPPADSALWDVEAEPDAEPPPPPLTEAEEPPPAAAAGGARLLLLRKEAARQPKEAQAAKKAEAEAAAIKRLTASGGEICGEGGLCSGHGTCNLETGECVCETMFSGPACEVEHCPGFKETGMDCNNHGLCKDGACQCAPGWGLLEGKEGANTCTDKVCPLPCDHGHCVDGACVCLPGWTGPNCRDPHCGDDCNGHGTCALPSTHSPGECICDYGWAGATCERPGLYQVMRSCPDDCNGNGLCLNGICSCNIGFVGATCNEVECGSNFAGAKCDVPRCPSDCHGQGLCMAGKCVCWNGYSGQDCSIPQTCANPCRRFCPLGAEAAEMCISCVGQCTAAKDAHVGLHDPFEDLEGTFLQK